MAENKYQMLVKELKKMNPEKGKIDSQRFWKIKKKVFPKSKDPPSAMLDKFSNLLTTQESIEARALEVYSERLQPNAIKEHLKSLEENTNNLCDLRLNLLKSIESDQWAPDDLKQAVKDLDRDKSRDALGHANELFKEEVAGTDLKLATLNHEYPEVLNPCNITSIYKQKGSHKDFENYRGVFRVTVLRSILDRLIYNDNYHTIDDNLTDGNVGARKQRNIRDNIFVLGAVTNSVLNGGESPIQVQVQDAVKCFDKLWLQATTNSLYEAGMTNNMLNLLYLENKSARVAVKINNQLTKRIHVKDVELQGSVWGSLKCTTLLDTLNKNILPQSHLTYKYKGDPNVEIGVLGMVDDNMAISKCGISSVQKNAVINSFMETKKIALSDAKSVVLHIGKKSKCRIPCP